MKSPQPHRSERDPSTRFPFHQSFQKILGCDHDKDYLVQYACVGWGHLQHHSPLSLLPSRRSIRTAVSPPSAGGIGPEARRPQHAMKNGLAHDRWTSMQHATRLNSSHWPRIQRCMRNIVAFEVDDRGNISPSRRTATLRRQRTPTCQSHGKPRPSIGIAITGIRPLEHSKIEGE